MTIIEKLKAIIKKHDKPEHAINEMIDEEFIVSMSQGRRLYEQLRKKD